MATIGAGINIGAGVTMIPGIVTDGLVNRALSATEVNQNFNALRGRYGI